MTTVLILTADETTRDQLGQLTRRAGLEPDVPREDEDARGALERARPRAVLLDMELAVPAELVPASARAGARVVYVSRTQSVYALAEFARRRGVAHFPLSGGPMWLRQLVDGDEPHPTLAAAEASVRTARQLVARSREVIATASELQATRRIMLAAARAGRGALREAVMHSAAEMRSQGMPLERMLALVAAAVRRSAARRGDGPHSAQAASELEAATRWCEEAYRAA